METPTEKLNEGTKEQVIDQSEVQPEITLDQAKLDRYYEQLTLEQNFPFGLIAGLIASIAGAIIWAVITVSTEYQIGYMALAVGFLVGFAIKFTGKGIDKIFGITGAILALFGCLLGNILSIIGFAAVSEGVSFFEIIPMIDFTLLPEVMVETFSPMDLLFYGIAIYEGYKFSFRNISEEDIVANAAK